MKTRTQQITEMVECIAPELHDEHKVSATRYFLLLLGGEGPEIKGDQLGMLFETVRRVVKAEPLTDWKNATTLRVQNYNGPVHTLQPIPLNDAEWLLGRKIDTGNVTLVPAQP